MDEDEKPETEANDPTPDEREIEDGTDTSAFLRRHAPYDRMKSEHVAFLVERLRPIRSTA